MVLAAIDPRRRHGKPNPARYRPNPNPHPKLPKVGRQEKCNRAVNRNGSADVSGRETVRRVEVVEWLDGGSPTVGSVAHEQVDESFDQTGLNDEDRHPPAPTKH